MRAEHNGAGIGISRTGRAESQWSTMTTTSTASTTEHRPAVPTGAVEHLRSAALVGGSMTSAHTGAAIATSVFHRVGAPGAVLLRQGLGSVIMLLIVRPRLRGRSRADWTSVVLLGLVFAVMNTCLWEAFARLPLGGAVTIELLGPLGLAVALSRRVHEVALVGLAGVGVVLLEGLERDVNLAGVGFALIAAGGWAAYILLSTRVGQRFRGAEGIALAMPVAALAVLPFGLATGGVRLLRPSTLAIGLVVSILSAAIPFTLEVHALRRVPQRIFGVIQSMSPVVAAVVGWLLLDQALGTFQLLAIGCVVAACVGTVWTARPRASTAD
jgi:inner membrane transporter RhtA